MNGPTDPTPYRPHGRPTRRRTLLIVAAAIVVVAIGLALHLTGVLPPE